MSFDEACKRVKEKNRRGKTGKREAKWGKKSSIVNSGGVLVNNLVQKVLVLYDQ